MKSEGRSRVGLLDRLENVPGPDLAPPVREVGGYTGGDPRVIALRRDAVLVARFFRPEAGRDG